MAGQGYKKIPILRSTAGLNNMVDPVRLVFDPEKGVIDLALAYNIDIDVSGRISRRVGQTLRGNFVAQDIFCDGGECLFVSGNALYRFNVDYTYTGIRSGLTTDTKMWYAQAGDLIYYANGYERGYVSKGVNYTWYAKAYVGPTTSRVFSDPPEGISILELYKGRMYAAKGNVLWHSEPFAYGWFDYAQNFISFPGDILFVKGVIGPNTSESDGLYIGTTKGVYFLEGDEPAKASLKNVCNSVPIIGTALRMTFAEKGVIWAAQDGIWMGKIGGKADCLTKDRLKYPSAIKGTGVFLNDKYIVLLQE